MDEDEVVALGVALLILSETESAKHRTTRERINWCRESNPLVAEGAFQQCYRKRRGAFGLLAHLLTPHLQHDYRAM